MNNSSLIRLRGAKLILMSVSSFGRYILLIIWGWWCRFLWYLMSSQQWAWMCLLTTRMKETSCKWRSDMDLALRLCCNEITCRGDALLQEMKQYDIIKSGGVGIIWTKGTSTAEGITSENSEAPFSSHFYEDKAGRKEYCVGLFVRRLLLHGIFFPWCVARDTLEMICLDYWS